MENLSAEICALSDIIYRRFTLTELTNLVEDRTFEGFDYHSSKPSSLIKNINSKGLIEIDFRSRTIVLYKGVPSPSTYLTKSSLPSFTIGECKMKKSEDSDKVVFEKLTYNSGVWDTHVAGMLRLVFDKLTDNKKEFISTFESIFE